MIAPATTLGCQEKADRLAVVDQVTAERYGVAVARCARCDWSNTRSTHAYALSALLAHDEHTHVTELDKRRRQQLVNARGRELAAELLAGRVTA